MLPEITLAEARVTLNTTIENLIAYVPLDARAEDFKGANPPTFAGWCDADESGRVNETAGITLPGGAQLAIHQNVDLDPVINRIAMDYELKAGWRVVRDVDVDGHLIVRLYSKDRYDYHIRYYAPEKSTTVWRFSIVSGSPCIPVPDDYNPHEKY